MYFCWCTIEELRQLQCHDWGPHCYWMSSGQEVKLILPRNPVFADSVTDGGGELVSREVDDCFLQFTFLWPSLLPALS